MYIVKIEAWHTCLGQPASANTTGPSLSSNKSDLEASDSVMREEIPAAHEYIVAKVS